jgi:ATP-dependent helicase HrpA
MLHLRLGDIEDFPFLEPPDSRQITDGVKLLEELGAVDKNRRLTEIGKQLAPLPVDPRLGRMLLAARQSGCLNEALIIAAALSVQDPRERPLDMQQAADLAQAQFQDENSDFVSFLKLWEFFQENAKHLSKSKLRKLCRDKFLSWTRMQEWQDIHQQLFTLAREHKWPMNEVPADYMSLHRALLTGLLGNIATVALASKDRADEANKSKNPKPDGYQGARGIKLYLFPGSGLFKKHPRWLMAAELVETGRLYARCAAKIEPEWIEQAAGALCRRSYFEPHWEKSSARVAAYEQVTVYGLTVVNRRKVDYSRIDPAACREIFIRAALVEGDYNSRAAFFLHNQKLVAEIRDMEHKARRPDILVDEQEIFAFYDARLPADIVGGAELDQWRREAEREAPKLLFLSREQLMRRDGVSRDEFPETLEIQGLRLKLSYQFEPGLENDGVTVQIPVQVLSQLRPARFDWLVPGLLKEKIAALLRGLPGATRRNFVPVPDFAQAAFEALTPGDTPLTAALGEYLHRISGGVTILPQDWKWDTLPPHLRCNFAILAENGEKLAQGRDLTSLQQQWKDRAQAGFASLPKAGLERDKVTAWDFGDLPDQVTLEAKGLKFPGFPALAEAGECAALKVFNDAAAAVRSHRAGLRCLLQHLAKTQLAQLRRQVPAALCLRYMALGSCDSLKDDLAAALLDKVFLAEPLPRRQADFEQRLKQGLARLFAEAAEMFKHLQDSLEAWNELRGLLANRGLAPAKDLKQLKGTLNPASHAALKDLRDHLEKLVYPGFVRACPPLQHFPRYLKAAQTRLQRLEQAPDKDARKAVELAPLWNAYWQRRPPQPDAAWQEFRWLLEEWRVSLFAQELKTAAPVSAQRMQKMWKELAG